MTKNFKILFKFFTVLLIMLGSGYAFYYYNLSDEFEDHLVIYKNKALFKTCPDSPETPYLECFRKDLGHLLSVGSPIEYLHIIDLENDLYRADLFKADGDQAKAQIEALHAENWRIFQDYIVHFRLKRNSLNFFQIIFIPLVKAQISEKYKEAQVEILKKWALYQSHLKDNSLKLRWKRSLKVP